MPHKLPETARLALRPITAADYDLYYLLNTDAEVMRHIGPPRSPELVREFLANMAADYARWPGLGRWFTVEKATGAVVGIHLLKPLEASGHIELGYRLLPAYWGRGYATEMGRALVEYGFQELGLQQIVGITAPDNLASQHVLEKCGLRYQHMAHFYGADVRFYTADNPA
ncbi:GNAT family N-acetyltransferase [Hymenobacter busanensis]|uniref:GNAT family N-acetyltransferase n=1 Tax=Hymenobacter busanensis TaxID=2607656 RepID=A0A7L4ZXL3_9BACT|nr:GNAT family N-acetyltransferase [Hymenobacter busanensis]KAA9327482.1 GNAT family N-acetyltransferase [Hymenobacter busanensis]QHJ06180.1 GNAT family N-acetyltransferase [Hymenobacter busanensis]